MSKRKLKLTTDNTFFFEKKNIFLHLCHCSAEWEDAMETGPSQWKASISSLTWKGTVKIHGRRRPITGPARACQNTFDREAYREAETPRSQRYSKTTISFWTYVASDLLEPTSQVFEAIGASGDPDREWHALAARSSTDRRSVSCNDQKFAGFRTQAIYKSKATDRSHPDSAGNGTEAYCTGVELWQKASANNTALLEGYK
ncbi:unnamed protein product [Zymoseptoria tritici ST99CH_1A5]|uniref:Uncharacterized protein n=1 Tax=Zymoseptoria tritici ST99CH_1A5 TaxID=1276529 RepID=A0A1Y6LLQ4_ZYMTR|nr:unnamed protein product [Zymoseptoria tritici ST99CH_1A5]